MKHETDGHLRQLTLDDIQVGLLVRSVGKDNSQSAFSDCVVIGVMASGVVLARPYLFADTIGNLFNHLQGIERFSLTQESLLRNYQGVEMSTGKLSNFNIR